MSAPPIQLYAELLPNIRQVSVSVSLASIANASTSVQVLNDAKDGVSCGTKLRVQHDGAVEEMALPGQVAVSGGSRLPLPKTKQGEQPPSYLTWRLPVSGDARLTRGSGGDDDLLAPWSAPDLLPKSRVACRGCGAVVVEADRVQAWKDLPSDNWAEMMEFWHCHKPDHHHGPNGNAIGSGDKDKDKANEADLAGRGYGANSVISAEAGVGFVDLITLLFSETDCQGLLFSESTYEKASAQRESILNNTAPSATPRGLNVFCASCHAQIGYFNLRMQSVNLFKWQVGCESTTAVGAVAPSVSDCVAATLVATIARTGSSKSVVLPIYELPVDEDEGNKVLQVWVLNSNICYSSSASASTAKPTLAIKLLYKHIERSEADDILDKLNSDIQEINLPSETIRTVTAQLETSNGLLPRSERAFKEWKIGLVRRWDPRESGCG